MVQLGKGKREKNKPYAHLEWERNKAEMGKIYVREKGREKKEETEY